MNRNLQYSIEFPAAIWHNHSLQINAYSVNLQITAVSDRPAVISVAMERIRAFVMSELANAMFISAEHENEAEMFEALGTNVCTLPYEPHDQIIGIMLYCKLNAITEGHLAITQLDISSSLGDEVWYQHSEEDALGPFVNTGWWHNKNCSKNNLPHSVNNVVKVDASGWQEYGLEWPDVAPTQQATIVKPNFRKNETNTTR